ncbi:MAG: glutaredoxin family protein [Gammaproteobacteria bacterium]|nr:glutaredoxin family protein [Gammaproteobacteria bacterium]
MSARRLTVVHREDCALCDEMIAELGALAATRTLPPLELLDVDSSRDLKKRYGLDVPVLLLDGAVVCRHRLDVAALERQLGAGGP